MKLHYTYINPKISLAIAPSRIILPPYKTDYYFVKDNGFIAQKEWINYHGVDYYADSAGRLVRNTFIEGTDNGHPVWYWINEKCEMVLDWTFVNYRNNLYIIKANGMMCDEMIVVNYCHLRDNSTLMHLIIS